MAVRVLRESGAEKRLLLTCEHASPDVPAEYANLGLECGQLRQHIGWDIGAASVTEVLSHHVDATAVLSCVSRLLVDCNRDLMDHDLMPVISHGVPVPGNSAIAVAEREKRIDRFHRPYHEAIDCQLASRPDALLLSIHSFTPSLNGRERPFDIGVLFDDYQPLAERLAEGLRAGGFTVRMNEPYSALDGLIFSARHHGRRSGRPYLEIEINNRLLQIETGARDVASRLIAPILALLDVSPVVGDFGSPGDLPVVGG